MFKTADLYDEFQDQLQVAEPIFQDFGGVSRFHGSVATLKLHEDNSLVRESLEQKGHNRVLVVDGGGSLRCALVGDRLAGLAHQNGWAGLVVSGAVRDRTELATIPIGLKALATNPRKSIKRQQGQRGLKVSFAGVVFEPGQYLYSDEDGLIVASSALH